MPGGPQRITDTARRPRPAGAAGSPAEQVRLADDLVEGARTHPHRERGGRGDRLLGRSVEQGRAATVHPRPPCGLVRPVEMLVAHLRSDRRPVRRRWLRPDRLAAGRGWPARAQWPVFAGLDADGSDRLESIQALDVIGDHGRTGPGSRLVDDVPDRRPRGAGGSGGRGQVARTRTSAGSVDPYAGARAGLVATTGGAWSSSTWAGTICRRRAATRRATRRCPAPAAAAGVPRRDRDDRRQPAAQPRDQRACRDRHRARRAGLAADHADRDGGDHRRAAGRMLPLIAHRLVRRRVPLPARLRRGITLDPNTGSVTSCSARPSRSTTRC